jgi:hypothetical protein
MFVIAVLVDAVVVLFAKQCLQIAMELLRQGDVWTKPYVLLGGCFSLKALAFIYLYV